ncbi:MAG: hypothetical protein AAF747_06520, partial [Planctomycetota bacterium]
IMLTDVPGVLDATGEPIASLAASEAEQLIEAGVIAGGMAAKVRAAARIAASSGSVVRIAPWASPAEALAGDIGTALHATAERAKGTGRRRRPTPALS